MSAVIPPVSFLDVLVSSEESEVSKLVDDCKIAFDSRSLKSSSDNYSEGSTYFIKANEKHKCNLENIALTIFKEHTKSMTFDPAKSGAEWWSQVIDSRDDIGFHWDRDYGIEEETGKHVYPYLASVTYLSDCGGPTVIMNKMGGSDDTVDITGKIDSFIASKPLFGKHIAFDGRLLHAAPSDLMEEQEEDSSAEESDEESQGSGDSGGSEDGEKRVTLLVNIWVDHIPVQSVRFPSNKMKTMSKSVGDKALVQFDPKKRLMGSQIAVNITPDDCVRGMKWHFNNSDTNFVVSTPLPPADVIEGHFLQYHCIEYKYPAHSDCTAEITVSDKQDSGSDSESDVENSEEGSEEESEEELPVAQPAKKSRKA